MLFVLSDNSSVEIEGTSEDLRSLSHKIKTCGDGCSIALAVPAAFDDRGLRYLNELVVKVKSHSVMISEAGQKLIISGDKEKLLVFSENIDSLLEPETEGPFPERDHLHVEYYPGHFFLCAEALPVILIRQE